MSVQIYYTYADRGDRANKLTSLGVVLDTTITKGNKTTSNIYGEIRQDKSFCRGQESIDYNYLLSIVQSDIVLYADIEDKLAGVLCFMFNTKPDGERIFNLNGICSSKLFAGNRVGELLIKTLISIAEASNIQGIYLDCKGSVKKYYEKLGFVKIKEKMVYDSDDSDDEGEPHYFMKYSLQDNSMPNLSAMTITGGKRKKIVKTLYKKYRAKKSHKTKKSSKTKRKFRK